jgi:hypothetical protein
MAPIKESINLWTRLIWVRPVVVHHLSMIEIVCLKFVNRTYVHLNEVHFSSSPSFICPMNLNVSCSGLGVRLGT